MKKFHFSLSAALQLRERQLQAERATLQRLLADEQTLKQAVENLAAERRETAAFIEGSTFVNATDLRALATFSAGADVRAASLQAQMGKKARNIQEQKTRVMQAERKAKLLGRLREKKFQTWTRELDREHEAAAQEAWLSKRHLEIHVSGINSDES